MDPAVVLPVGAIDLDSRPFWEGLRRHVVLVQRCEDCLRHRFPPMPACPFCSSPRSAFRPVRGGGAVYSAVVVRHPFSEAAVAEVPYQVAVVELDEECRLLGRVDGSFVPIGAPVVAMFVDHEGWTELRWRSAIDGEDER